MSPTLSSLRWIMTSLPSRITGYFKNSIRIFCKRNLIWKYLTKEIRGHYFKLALNWNKILKSFYAKVSKNFKRKFKKLNKNYLQFYLFLHLLNFKGISLPLSNQNQHLQEKQRRQQHKWQNRQSMQFIFLNHHEQTRLRQEWWQWRTRVKV